MIYNRRNNKPQFSFWDDQWGEQVNTNTTGSI